MLTLDILSVRWTRWTTVRKARALVRALEEETTGAGLVNWTLALHFPRTSLGEEDSHLV